jgi:uncharacterized protein
VLRLDFAPITGARLTSTGALRIEAALGRTGVLVYQTPAGPRRELRPPDEVFRADSMGTLAGAVVTDLHPPREEGWITPSTWRKHAIGFVGDHVRQDGRLLRGTVTVQDEAAIALIRDGKRREISPGYICQRIDVTPGRWDGNDYGPHVTSGEPYDCIQRDITYNSVGIGPRGWGRQGSDVALRLDSLSADAAILRVDGSMLGAFVTQRMRETGVSFEQLTGGENWASKLVLDSVVDGLIEQPTDEQLRALSTALDVRLDTLIRLIPADKPKRKGTVMEDTEIHLDGLTVKVPQAAAQVVQKAIADRDTKLRELTALSSASQAKLDAADETLKQLKAELADAPAKARAEAKARVELEGKAAKVLGADFKLDGKTDRELREAVVAKLKPKAELAGKDDAYVAARFDAALDDFDQPSASARVGNALFPDRSAQPRQDAADDKYDPAAARARMIERNQTAWQPKS